MQNQWILDVLADLKTFSHENGLNTLAIQLEETKQLATRELAKSSGVVSEVTNIDERPRREFCPAFGTR